MKKQLLNGDILRFSNEKFQTATQNDDIRLAELWHESDTSLPTWSHGFKLWFNGKLIHSSKTWKSMEKRLNTLIENWNLTQINSL